MSAKKAAGPPKDMIQAGIDVLLKLNEKNAKNGSRMFRASEWNPRYLDFMDLRTGTPCLPLEYFFGCRGLIGGRVFTVVAMEAVGKSTLLTQFYGMGQRSPDGGAWVDHIEAEKTPSPPDFIASLGCDPNKMLVTQPPDVESGLAHVTEYISTIRTKLDPTKKLMIIMGIDSVSALAGEMTNDETGVSSGGQGIAPHSRAVSEFFRDKLGYIEHNDAILLFTGQKKSKVESGGFGGGEKKSTYIAEGTIKFHSSWIVEMYKQKLEEGDNNVVGDRITATMEKNKLAPKGRKIEMWLYRDGRGLDMSKANVNLLFSNTSPFEAGTFSASGGWYRQDEVRGGKNLHKDEFIHEFYQNTELVQRCREKLRIRGFKFKFEMEYPIGPASAEPAEDDSQPGIEEFDHGPKGAGAAAPETEQE